MEKKLQAKLQFVDSYVQDSYIKVHKRSKNSKKNLQIDITAKMSNVNEISEKELCANLILTQKLQIYDEENKEVLIELAVSMVGSFIGKGLEKERFIEMVKYNGAPQLSLLIRSYVITLTSVGGLEPIRIPMINFAEFFKNERNNE